MDMINGNKTYVVAGVSVIIGLLEAIIGGILEPLEIGMSGGDMIWSGLLVFTGRSALKKLEK
jgi:hypothetical protein